MRAIDSGDVEEERRLAYVGITRAMRELYLTFAESRMTNGNFMTNVKSRFLDELPEELCDIVVSERRQSWSSWNRGSQQSSFGSGGGGGGRFRGAGEYNRPGAPQRKQPEPGKSYSLGDDVEHAAFGEGVVIGIEPGGLVVVRFAGDGSEKKLMADYAPLTKK
jgi:DNA helicase-2/ATP-dependent DNA helicase PcrA